VVRTAANAAWAVPAIQIATSAPAFAAVSQNDAALVNPAATTMTAIAGDNKGWKVSDLKVQNDGPKSVTVVITISVTSPKWDAAQPATPGWTVTSGAGTAAMTLRYSGVVPVVSTSPYEHTITGPSLKTQAAGAKSTEVSASIPVIASTVYAA
jgi:hypothetical protein